MTHIVEGIAGDDSEARCVQGLEDRKVGGLDDLHLLYLIDIGSGCRDPDFIANFQEAQGSKRHIAMASNHSISEASDRGCVRQVSRSQSEGPVVVAFEYLQIEVNSGNYQVRRSDWQ